MSQEYETYKDLNWFIFIKKNLKEVCVGLVVIIFGMYAIETLFFG